MQNEKLPYFEEKFSFTFFQSRRWLASAIACVAATCVLIGYFQSGPNVENYVAASDAVHRWEELRDDASYLAMQKALKMAPALQDKYRLTIAQRLVHMDKLEEGLAIAQKALQQMEGEIPFHAAYGRSSLLIEQGAYQDALEKTVSLKEQMARVLHFEHLEGGELEEGSLLYAHNLLRIACLQQELKNKPGEKAAWDELEGFLKSKTVLMDLVYSDFQEKGLHLGNYIAERRRHL